MDHWLHHNRCKVFEVALKEKNQRAIPCAVTLVASVSFTSKLEFYTHKFVNGKFAKKIHSSNIYVFFGIRLPPAEGF